MTINTTTVYIFELPKEYKAMKEFEKTEEAKKFRKVEDSLCTRFIETTTTTIEDE